MRSPHPTKSKLLPANRKIWGTVSKEIAREIPKNAKQ
jgi:hypothetical protein